VGRVLIDDGVMAMVDGRTVQSVLQRATFSHTLIAVLASPSSRVQIPPGPPTRTYVPKNFSSFFAPRIASGSGTNFVFDAIWFRLPS